jgi:hypothetical protein
MQTFLEIMYPAFFACIPLLIICGSICGIFMQEEHPKYGLIVIIILTILMFLCLFLGVYGYRSQNYPECPRKCPITNSYVEILNE